MKINTDYHIKSNERERAQIVTFLIVHKQYREQWAALTERKVNERVCSILFGILDIAGVSL